MSAVHGVNSPRPGSSQGDRSRSPYGDERERNGPCAPNHAVGECGTTVSGVDFETVRKEITREQVLDLLGFQPSKRSGVQW